ncbi:MAG TPA: hypothetical protein VNX28_13610 [Gemmataceae bacterium]|nr:hypothetical protein [Gemmataceae bacterium]
MFKFRWLGVALFALAATSAAHAQTAPFSILGLSSLFGQERYAGVLPWLPQAAGYFLRGEAADASEESDSPPLQRGEGDALTSFIPECLRCWKEQWNLGNYLEAEMLANIACRLDPTNVAAQHAIVLSEIMQVLTGGKETCSGGQCARPGAATDVAKCGWCTATSVERIEQKLDEPISVSFKDTPLHQVIDDLRELAGVNIVPDRSALQDADISLDMPLTLAVEKISLKSVLNLLLDQAKLTCLIKDEVLQITTKEKARGRLRTVTFPVADLVTPDSAMSRIIASGFSPYEPTPPGLTVEEALMSLIQKTIATDSWRELGGRGAIQFFPLGQALVVSQTQEVQEDIAALLASLRNLQSDLEGAVRETQVAAAEAACCAAAGAARSCCQAAAAQGMPMCPACAKAGVVMLDGPFTPFGLVNSQFAGIKAITGLTPAGTLTPDLGIVLNTGFDFSAPPFCGYPDTRSAPVKTQPDCCLAASAKTEAKDCDAQSGPHGTLTFGLGFNFDTGIIGRIFLNTRNVDACAGAASAGAAKAAAACDKNAGCRTITAPATSVRSIMVLPPPTAWIGEDPSAALPLAPAPRMPAGSVFAVSPPIYVSGPYPVPAPTMVPPMPPRAPSVGVTRAQLNQYQPPPSAENGCALMSDTVRNTVLTDPAPENIAPAANHNVHVVTPHLEAHCDRLTSGNPDHLVLEGNVQLVCFRNGQTLRIQGQRVHVHLTDGTFTVESTPEPSKPVSASQVRIPAATDYRVQPASYPAPWEMVRPVRPVNGPWEYQPYKPEE